VTNWPVKTYWYSRWSVLPRKKKNNSEFIRKEKLTLKTNLTVFDQVVENLKHELRVKGEEKSRFTWAVLVVVIFVLVVMLLNGWMWFHAQSWAVIWTPLYFGVFLCLQFLRSREKLNVIGKMLMLPDKPTLHGQMVKASTTTYESALEHVHRPYGSNTYQFSFKSYLSHGVLVTIKFKPILHRLNEKSIYPNFKGAYKNYSVCPMKYVWDLSKFICISSYYLVFRYIWI
jgi:hypothetical protein